MTYNQSQLQHPAAGEKKKSKLLRNITILLGWFLYVFSFFNFYLALSGLVPEGQFLRFFAYSQSSAILFFGILPFALGWLNNSRRVVHALKGGEDVPDERIQFAQESLIIFPQKMALATVAVTMIVSLTAGLVFMISLKASLSRVIIFFILGSLTGIIVAWGLYFGVKMLNRENAQWLMREISRRGLPRTGRPFPLAAKVFTGIIILVFYLLSLFVVTVHYTGGEGIPFWPTFYIFTVGGSVCLIFAWFLTNDFVYSLRDLNRFVGEVAKGDLEAECRYITEDEIGEVGFAAVQMARNLKESWGRASELMDKMLDTAARLEEEVKKGLTESMDQAAKAIEQSATIHEVSTTADEVAATGRIISDSTRGVADLSKETLESCRRGQDNAQKANQTIEQLQAHQTALQDELYSLLQRSARIREIVALIDAVVDQVELLSVNAALEAAGAGEAGRRFSVVAMETKRLAGQTQNAVQDVRKIVKEIQDAINEFQRRHDMAIQAIEQQSGMVMDTGEALQEIVGLMERTAGAAEQIRIGSGQQTQALNEVQRILSELNITSQNIADGADKVEKIMKEISELASELRAVKEWGSAGGA